jgi:uroporphyrinogen decarboxylase
MSTRKDTMTNRQRMEAILHREKPDRVPHLPLAFGFCTVYAGGTVGDAYANPSFYLSAERKAARDFDWVSYPLMPASTALASEFGGDIKYPSGEYSQAPMITRLPVETVEEAMNLKMPDILNSGTVPLRLELCRLSSKDQFDNEPFNTMMWAGGPFTNAACIMGIERMSKWMLKKPAVAHHVLRMATDYYLQMANYWKELFGTKNVLTFYGEPSASNQVISPKQFEEFTLPYLKELSEKLINMGYKHLYGHVCGEQNANLVHWAKIPFGDPGIVSIGHEVELEVAAEYFPNDIIMGNIEPAIIQMATPNKVYDKTADLVKRGKKLKAAGFIFSQGCELPPLSPIENIKAMTDAINDYGWYD